MNTNKLLVGTLIGGVAFFLLGWVLYGMVFGKTLAELMPNMAAIQRPNMEYDMVAMVVANLALGFFLAYIFEKWASIRSFMGGLVAGATLFFVIAFAYDSIWHATTTVGSWGGTVLDAVISAVQGGLAGGVIGWWLGYNRK
jgi:uncharacterized membrane protein YqhA